MNPFERQTQILSDLGQAMHDSADQNYEKIECIFTFNSSGNWSKAEFSYTKDGKEISEFLKKKDGVSEYSLLEELHTIMKNHTGGEWDSFTLTLDADGKAHTKFHYPDAAS
jgi:Protein of unknown function, DUF600